MKMSFIIFLFSISALLLAACSALNSNDAAGIVIEESPIPSETLSALPSAAQSSAAVLPGKTSESPENPVSSSDLPNSSSTLQPSPFFPQAGDEKLNRGNVFIDSADLLTLESYPLQFRLRIVGNLPDPCHQLRLDIHSPDAGQRVVVEAYSVADPEAFCAQVLVPFDESIPLEGLPAGAYTVVLDGQELGEIVVSR